MTNLVEKQPIKETSFFLEDADGGSICNLQMTWHVELIAYNI